MLLHEVITTEKVPFTYRVAGMGSRLLAWLIDCGFIILLYSAGALAVSVYEAFRPGLGQALIFLWMFLLLWGYFLLFEWLWRGQTPGKRVVGIRVVQQRGTAITLFQSAVRNLVRFADAFPFLYTLGFGVAASNREHRRLGDLAAGTLVVHVEGRPRAVTSPEQVEAAFEREGNLRQRVGQLDHAQKQTLVELCLRREQVRPRDRARLFARVAAYFRERFDLAPAEYQSPEKFVMELAALVNEQGRRLPE